MATGMHDLRLAVRALRGQPGLTAAAVLTLALGIGANAAIFSVVEGVLLRPLPYPSGDRLVTIWNHWTASDVRTVMAAGDLTDFREQTTLFEAFAAANAFALPLTGEGDAVQVSFGSATSNWFSFLGTTPAIGRDFLSEPEPGSVIVSHGFWQDRLGGDANVIGRGMVLNGTTYTVVGVLPQDFKTVGPRLWGIPPDVKVWSQIDPDIGTDRTAHWMRTVGRLKPGVTVAQAQAELDALAARVRAAVPARAERHAEYIVAPLHAEIVKPVRTTVLLLWIGVVFVLMIACANVANLQIAKSRGRLREMATRMALGAGRLRIFQQVLTESAVLVAIGGALGLLFGWAGIRLLSTIRPEGLPRFDNIAFNGSILAFSVAISLVAVFVTGITPAFRLARTDLHHALGSGGRGASARHGLLSRRLLTAGEVAMSLILLVGTGLMARTVLHLIQIDPGFQTRDVLSFRLPAPRGTELETFHREVEERLRGIAGVESVGSIFHTPLAGKGESSEYTNDESQMKEYDQRGASRLVTGDYFETVGIPLVAGRYFRPGDGGDVVIVDQKLAKRVWGDTNPIGQRLKVGWWSGPVWARVIGVVPSLRSEYVYAEDRETLYRVAFPFAYMPQTFVVRSAQDPVALTRSIRHAMREIYPDVPLTDVKPLAAYRAEQMAPSRFVLTLLGLFAGIGVVLACVGLYGVIAHTVSLQTREIGIRIALGARGHEIVAMVLGRGLGLGLTGVGVGLVGTVALTRFMQSLLHGVPPTDPLTLTGAGALLVLVILGAAYLPARHATRVDPAVTLRCE